MTRLNVVQPETASGQTKALFDSIAGAIGTVPNIHRGLGNSPAALEGLLQIEGSLRKASLTGAEIEAIKLAVSQAYDCNYCLAAHTLLGTKAGLPQAETIRIRRGGASQPRLAALVRFVSTALRPDGTLADADLAAIRQAGYTDGQIAEITLVIGQTVFTNLFNRVNQTQLDFPPAPAL
ncbi:MAG: carboxymuconolactone decarboxylase family protein [Gammaproteobacteria bacterium]